MAKISRQIGTTSLVCEVFVQDSSKTTGVGLTGIAYNAAGLTCYYKINTGTASVVASINHITTLGTYVGDATHAGWAEVDATNMPGTYEINIPNNALLTGADSVVVYFQGVTNMAPLILEIELTATNNQDGVHGGMSALPNTACASNASLLTVGSGTAQINASGGKVPATLASTDVTGNVAADLQTIKTQTVTCAAGVTVYPAVGSANELAVDASGRVDLGKILGTASAGAAGYVGIDWNAIDNPTATVALTNTTISSSTSPTAAQVATAVWQDTTAGDFTVAGSIGLSLKPPGGLGTAPGASGGLFVAGTNDHCTITNALTVSGTTTLTGNVAVQAGLTVTQSTLNGNGVTITGNGTGTGLAVTGGQGATFTGTSIGGNGVTFTSGSSGDALALVASGAASTGLYIAGATGIGITASAGAGILCTAGANSPGISIAGNSTGEGIKIVSGTTCTTAALYVKGGSGSTAHGILATSGSGATGDGIHATAASTNGYGLYIAGAGANAGTYSIGGTTGHGIQSIGGATSGDALNLICTSGNGITATGGTNGHGAAITGAGTGNGILSTGGATGGFESSCGMQLVGGAGGSNGLLAQGIGGYDAIIGYANGTGSGINGQSGGGGHGISATGNGTGHGIRALSGAGATGDGINATSQATAGKGLSLTGNGTGEGMKIVSGTSCTTAALYALAGSGSSAAGIQASGNTAGLIAAGIGTNSNGIQATAAGTGAGIASFGGATNGPGSIFVGVGTGAGIAANGGAGGAGGAFTGGSTGHGILATSGTGATGDGIHAVAASTNGNGMSLTGTGTGSGLYCASGSGANGDGITAVSQSSNGYGASLTGSGSLAGLLCQGGITGNGASILGGSVSGNGATFLASGSGYGAGFFGAGTSKAGIFSRGGSTSSDGITAVGQGTGNGLTATSGSGATGDGIHAVAASTNGNGMSLTGMGIGDGLLATSGSGATGDGARFVSASAGGSGLTATGGNGVYSVLLGSGAGIAGAFVNSGYGTGVYFGSPTYDIDCAGSNSIHGYLTGVASPTFVGDGVQASPNWATIVNPTHTVALSGTTISASQVVASVTGNVGGNVVGNVNGNVTGSIGGFTAAALAEFFTTNTTKVYADAIAGSVVFEIASNAGGGTPPTPAQIATAVWQDATAGDFTVAGSIGKTLGGCLGTSVFTSAGIITAAINTFVKNTAFNNFMFPMYNSTTHELLTGLTVTGKVSIDGAAFVSLTNGITEITGTGVYKINLAAADLNGTSIMLKFTATDADDNVVSIQTQ